MSEETEVKNEVKAENNGSQGSVDLEEPEQYRKLFIGGLSLSTTDDNLREYYSQWGTIVDCVVMRDSVSKKSRGFGFVSYATRSEVDKAMEARPHTIDGKQVDPKRAVPRELSSRGEANVSTNRLYVSGVREEHTEEGFKEYFTDFGTVNKVEIITDKQTNKPRGFGFITFEDYDSVDKCVLKKSHMINGHRCDVKKALSRDEMARVQQSERDRGDRANRMRGPGGPRGGPGGWGRGGPGGNFREPHGGYGAGPWNQGPPQQWGQGGYGGGYGAYGAQGGGSWNGADQWGGQQGASGGWAQQGGAAGGAAGYGGGYQATSGWGGRN